MNFVRKPNLNMLKVFDVSLECQAILKIIFVLHKTNLPSHVVYSITYLSICDIGLPVTVSKRLNAGNQIQIDIFKQTYGKYLMFL